MREILYAWRDFFSLMREILHSCRESGRNSVQAGDSLSMRESWKPCVPVSGTLTTVSCPFRGSTLLQKWLLVREYKPVVLIVQNSSIYSHLILAISLSVRNMWYTNNPYALLLFDSWQTIPLKQHFFFYLIHVTCCNVTIRLFDSFDLILSAYTFLHKANFICTSFIP